VIWYGASSTFTVNRYEVGNTFDRSNDLLFLRSYTTTSYSLVVSQYGVNNVDELTELLRKRQSYYGISMGGIPGEYLAKAFLANKQISATMIKYANFPQIARALENKEIDFSVYLSSGIYSTKEINNSISNVAEINGFNYETLSTFAIPKELESLKIELQPYFDQLCSDTEIESFVLKIGFFRSCKNSDEIKIKLDEELRVIEKAYQK
jgi:tripartite-type tricarboxylate transporter receptor subunit TctC